MKSLEDGRKRGARIVGKCRVGPEMAGMVLSNGLYKAILMHI